MRLNALYPSDNPMEELLFCFGGDDSGGGGGGDSADDADSMDSGYDTSTVGMGTSTDRDFGGGGDNDRDSDPMGMASLAAEAERATGGVVDRAAAEEALSALDRGDDGGRDYVTSPVTAPVTAPSLNIGAQIDEFLGRTRPSYAGQAAAQAQPVGTGTVLAPTSTTAVATPTAAITPATGFAYDPYAGTVLDRSFLSRPSPELPSMSAVEYGLAMGIPSPVNLPNAYFDDGTQRAYFSPATGIQTERLSYFDQPPTPASEQNFVERAFSGLKQAFQDVPQSMTQYTIDPATGLPVQAGPAMYKSSENVVTDVIGNLLIGASPFGALTGVVNTQEYTPYSGGTYTDPVTGETVGTPRETYQYATAKGGLLSGLIDGSLTPMSEINERGAGGGEGGDGGQRAPLIVPEQTPEEERAQSAFPAFTPRRFEYQPFTSKFYTIPSRFTRPTSLLG